MSTLESEITIWHRQVQLYQEGKAKLAEIIRQWAFNSVIGMLGMTEADRQFVGYNDFDNAPLYDALVLGIINTDRDFTQQQIADMLRFGTGTVFRTLKRLEEKHLVVKGAQHFRLTRSIEEMGVPKWIIEFTRAMVELEENPALRAQAEADMKAIDFLRGMRAITKDLRNKIYNLNRSEDARKDA